MATRIDIEEEITASRDTIARLQRESEVLRLALIRARERLALLERLKALESPGGSGVRDQGDELEQVSPRSLEDSVVEFLQAMNKPMHISMIRQHLEREAVPIPGKGIDANVITRISRDARIVRSPGKRGFYTLKKA